METEISMWEHHQLGPAAGARWDAASSVAGKSARQLLLLLL